MKIDNVIFDFDGTLADTEPGILASAEYAIKKMGGTVPPYEKMREFTGPALFISFQTIAGFSADDALKAIDVYREFYIPKGIYMCSVFDGIEDVLKALKDAGISLCVASSKPQFLLDIVIKHLKLDRYFDKIVGASPDVKTNEKKDLLLAAKTGENAVMIGDTAYDIEAAKEVGLKSIAVTHGFLNRQTATEVNPDYIVADARQIIKIILG